jgi:dCMP deaminase
MGIAEAIAVRGDCTRRRVGALILDPRHRVVSWGYNGTAPGKPGCLGGACPRGLLDFDELPDLDPSYDTPGRTYCIATHAELNALVSADPVKLAEATMYVTLKPCDPCYKVIRTTQIYRVVYITDAEIRSELV